MIKETQAVLATEPSRDGIGKVICIKTIKDAEKGSLSFFEAQGDFPFEIKRVYYTYEVPQGTTRGGHAHKSLWQFLWCPYGSINIILDDGHTRVEVLLDSPSTGLVLAPHVWHDMEWMRPGSVLCVAASDYYDAADYIRDYNEFSEYIKCEECK